MSYFEDEFRMLTCKDVELLQDFGANSKIFYKVNRHKKTLTNKLVKHFECKIPSNMYFQLTPKLYDL